METWKIWIICICTILITYTIVLLTSKFVTSIGEAIQGNKSINVNIFAETISLCAAIATLIFTCLI